MNSELEKIINSKTNLDDYLKEYGENSLFLYNYYLQNINRVLTNFYVYQGYLSVPDKIKLIYNLLDNNLNYEILNYLLTDIINYYLDDKYTNEINLLLNDLVKRDKENKIDATLLSIKRYVYNIDPLYFLDKDFNEINEVVISDRDTLIKILDLGAKKKYMFSPNNSLFIEYTIFEDVDVLVYFINNCTYDDYVIGTILAHFDTIADKVVLHDIYQRINNDELKEFLANTLNFDNYDINTIGDNGTLYLYADEHKDETMKLLKELKEKGINRKVILIVNRINLEDVDKAHEIYGDNLRISPLMNQEHKKDYEEMWDYPDYSIDEIKSSESAIDLYVKTTMDKLDKDGEIKSLSPFEKFIAAYILTTKFAPYNEEEDTVGDYHISRSVYEFIDKTTNKKIVCVGYVHLLQEFLYRMGVEATIQWNVHSKDEEEKNHTFGDNHARMLIHLVDPKYHIDGVYMSDPTWDEKATWSKLEGSYQIQTDHMLMSRNEIQVVDPEFTDDDLHLYSINYDQIEELLNVDNVEKRFNKPISKDTIVRGFLAVEHFLDKNMKMTDNYSDLEYHEMAIKLGFEDKKDLSMAPSYFELLQMNRSDLHNYLEVYPDLKYDFLAGIRIDLKDIFKESGIDLPMRIINRGITVDFDINTEYLKQLEASGYKVIYGLKRAMIDVYTYNDEPMIEQFDKMVESLQQFQSVIDNVTLENRSSGVK